LRTNGHWLISVGELSGDLLGAELVRELKQRSPQLQLSGIVGPYLSAEGVHALAHIDELNMMGIAELLQKISNVSIVKRKLLEFVDRNSIKVAILVDFAGFHLRLAEELKMRGVFVVQYMAPKLWAWGENRISSLKSNVDLLLAGFPFEENYFRSRGVNCHYIRCPMLKRTESVQRDKNMFGLSSTQTVFALLPGSRTQEFIRLLRPMLDIAKRIRETLKEAEFLIPVAASLQDEKVQKLINHSKESYIHFIQGKSLEIMASADAALLASGTATLECALVNTPLAVVYAMNPLTFYLAKKKVKIPWVSLVNILREKSVLEEYLQNIDVNVVANELISLVENSGKREAMLKEFLFLRDDLEQATQLTAVDHIYQALKKQYV
jgi:lipid-A-disaccharide synthase